MTYRLVFTSPGSTIYRYQLDAPNRTAAIFMATHMVPKNPVYTLESVEMVS